VMVAVPMPAPVTCGCVAGLVAPCGMTTLAGVIVTFEVSLLFTVRVAPPAGAGADSVTAKEVDWPRFTDVLAGDLIVPVTVTLAVALAMFGPLAVIVAVPGAIATTDTVTLVAPAAKLIVPDTVALLVSLEFKLNVRPPAGACPPLKVKVSFPDSPTLITTGEPVKEIVGGVTVTAPAPEM